MYALSLGQVFLLSPSLDTATAGHHCWWPLAVTSATHCRHHEMNAEWLLFSSLTQHLKAWPGVAKHLAKNLCLCPGLLGSEAGTPLPPRSARWESPSPPNRKRAAPTGQLLTQNQSVSSVSAIYHRVHIRLCSQSAGITEGPSLANLVETLRRRPRETLALENARTGQGHRSPLT